MGYCITTSQCECISEKDLLKPVIFVQKNCPIKDKAVPLNVLLAKKLIAIDEEDRSTNMADCVLKIIQGLPVGSVIKDFDVLFNPAYAIDVLQILVLCCKQHNFQVIWPGRYDNGKLIYADVDSLDYKTYRIENYDITCVV
ncbi:MAG: BREX-3 system P-loop-containing protein BrxF [Phascolarctobacterium sp.]|nr:BREX-3 system P-loop-containing protein BrxF [Phascolarctobacterium sp.]